MARSQPDGQQPDPEIDWPSLVAVARNASENAYSPYSGYRVGAAVLADNGEVFSGANVENASYGLTNCAERSAVFYGVSHGLHQIVALAIYTPTDEPAAPCGACRQVLREFGGGGLKVVSACNSEGRLERTLDELLPDAFGPTNLGHARIT